MDQLFPTGGDCADEATVSSDPQLERVVAELRKLDPDGVRLGEVLRNTFDQLLDGQRTGRFDWADLRKTEKTHMGTVVEINVHREFGFADGTDMDYEIAGVEVDCKFSQSLGGWMLPLESVGHLCLLITASDDSSSFQAGVVRVTEDKLRQRIDRVTGEVRAVANRDRKRQLSRTGMQQVVWLWGERKLPENLLLHLAPEARTKVMTPRGGSERLAELFKAAEGRLIRRSVIETVARQADALKRVRGNGGARESLEREGYVVLGHWAEHRRIAKELGLPTPSSGQFVSVRLVPTEPTGVEACWIQGQHYRRALPTDPLHPAPHVPRAGAG